MHHDEPQGRAEAAAQERLPALLDASPAVLYSFRAGGDHVPTFVSPNIARLFGYEPGEYLERPGFWRERVHPDDPPRAAPPARTPPPRPPPRGRRPAAPASSRPAATRGSTASAARTGPTAGS